MQSQLCKKSNDPHDVSTPSFKKIFHSVETPDVTISGLGQSQLSSREINTSSWKETTDDEGLLLAKSKDIQTRGPKIWKVTKDIQQ